APPPPGAMDDAPLRPPRPPPRTRLSPCHLGRPQRPALGCVERHQLPPRPNRRPAEATQRKVASHLAGAVLVARKGSVETSPALGLDPPLLCWTGRPRALRAGTGDIV